MASEVTVRVPAKVNLFLGVGPKQFSGFHNLATVFQSVGIYDEITIRPASEFEIKTTGPYAQSIPTDQSNLVWKAVSLIAKACGEDPFISVTINKSIPVAAGMAGGSADAAATLVACDAYWNSGLSRSQIDAMAKILGSDVPFMLHGGCALGTGRGDVLAPIMTRGIFHWVFATFNNGLSTSEVYARFDKISTFSDGYVPEVPNDVLVALAHADADALADALHNDLQSAALTLRPGLADTLEFGMDHGALGALISGSGPTCAFLVGDEASALDLRVALSSSGLADGAIHTHGPVHGARIVLH